MRMNKIIGFILTVFLILILFSTLIDKQKAGRIGQQNGQTSPSILLKSDDSFENIGIEKQNKPISKTDPKKITDNWQGTLKIALFGIRVILKISENSDTAPAASMNSPDQSVKDIPAAVVLFENNYLRIEVDAVGGVFEGKLSENNNEIIGNWINSVRHIICNTSKFFS